MDNLEIADRIKKRCKGMKISVKSLLDDCGINHGFIYDLEHKNSAPDVYKRQVIRNAVDRYFAAVVLRMANLHLLTTPEYLQNPLSRSARPSWPFRPYRWISYRLKYLKA